MRIRFSEQLQCAIAALWICVIALLFVLEHSYLIAYLIVNLYQLLNW